MSKKLATTYQAIALGVYLCLAVGLEFLYREPLFDKSIIWEKDWQLKESESFEKFFKAMTHFGSEAVLIPLLGICLFSLPLNKSYSFICSLVYATYFDNLMKIFYGNPRPYWVDTSLFKACDGGFGNPSGHSFTSSAVYLSFWHLMTDFSFFKTTTIGLMLRIVLFVVAILLIITIMLTRVYLGVHGVNQVLYGASLGVATYYLIFHIFAIHQWKADDFFKLFREKFYKIAFTLWYGILIITGLLVWAFKENNTAEWDDILKSLCPNLHEFRKYNNDGLFGMLVLLCLIGCHYGIMFLVNMTDNAYSNRCEEVNSWHKSESFLKHIYRILIIILFGLPLVLNGVVPSSSSLAVVFIFKLSVPYLLATFGIFGPAIFLLLKWRIGNMNIFVDSISSDMEKPYEMK